MERRDLKRGTAGAATLGLAALLLAGCADAFPKLTYAERYCYRTLADVDCHAEPLAGEDNRRVGFYDEPIIVE
ncbi:MAG: hypothetical protein GEU89_15920 [Kiloniellaceae bacterium]|nr:hypothetical protein [Kiloniellaceae bacterium]